MRICKKIFLAMIGKVLPVQRIEYRMQRPRQYIKHRYGRRETPEDEFYRELKKSLEKEKR